MMFYEGEVHIILKFRHLEFGTFAIKQIGLLNLYINIGHCVYQKNFRQNTV